MLTMVKILKNMIFAFARLRLEESSFITLSHSLKFWFDAVHNLSSFIIYFIQ